MTVSKAQREKEIAELINARRIIGGPSDKFHSISHVRYPWAIELLEKMMHNEWFPKRISLVKDRNQYQEKPPTHGVRIAVDRALAFLTNLDAIQVENLAMNIGTYITDPTLKLVIYRQTWEEALHVFSYSYVIENICDDPMHIYDMYNVNPTLKAKNDFVVAQANALRTEAFTEENFLYALVSNILLEGVYFHSGFLLFYVLERLHREFLGAANEIRYIQRDETSHLVFFINMFNSLVAENPGILTDKVKENIYKLFDAGTNLEITWGNHIIEHGVAGMTPYTNDQYIKVLANKRLKAINLNPLYEGVENPYPWVDAVAQVNSQEKNFFEGKPENYSKKALTFEEDDED